MTYTDLFFDLTSVWFYCLAFSSILLCLILVWRITFHPLAKFPGPRLWAVSRTPWHVALHRGTLHRKIHELHLKYGPIVRIAPDEVSIIQEGASRDVYSNKNFERNDRWFRPQRNAQQGDSMMTHKEDSHTRLRKAFMGAFTDSGIAEMSPIVESYSNLLVEELGKKVGEEGGSCTVDLVQWMNLLTFDIVGDLAFGASFDNVATGQAHPWVAISLGFGRGVALNTSLNFLAPLDRLFSFIIPKAVKEKFWYHQALTRERVQKLLASGNDRISFLRSATRYNANVLAKGDPEKIITFNEMCQNMGIFIFAGSETTATSLASVIRHTLQNHRVQNLLEKEIRPRFATQGEIKVATAGKLEYTNAVIYEAMRLGPPSVIGVPRYTRSGAYVCGNWIPAKTLVSVNQFAMYRHPLNFVEPDEFQPERFLASETKGPNKVDIFQPFISGRHQCIGYKLAWATLKTTIAKLFFAFDMELADASGFKDYAEQQASLFWHKEPLMVRLRSRC